MLKLLDFMKIDAVQDDLGGVKPAQALFYCFVNQTVIRNRRLQTHAAYETDDFQTASSRPNQEIRVVENIP